MAMLSCVRAFSSVSHSSERKNPFNSPNIESERDGPAVAWPYPSTAIFDLNHPPCPLFVICAREENFASFAISPHAGIVIGERASHSTYTHTMPTCYRTRAQKTKVEKSSWCNLPTAAGNIPLRLHANRVFWLELLQQIYKISYIFIASRLMFAAVGNLCRRRE